VIWRVLGLHDFHRLLDDHPTTRLFFALVLAMMAVAHWAPMPWPILMAVVVIYVGLTRALWID
jgi:hypothetical protein